MLTAVGESTQVTIQYRLPQKIRVGGFWHTSDHYSFLLQKQSGIDMLVDHELVLPQNIKIHSTYPDSQPFNAPFVLNADHFSGAVFEQS